MGSKSSNFKNNKFSKTWVFACKNWWWGSDTDFELLEFNTQSSKLYETLENIEILTKYFLYEILLLKTKNWQQTGTTKLVKISSPGFSTDFEEMPLRL